MGAEPLGPPAPERETRCLSEGVAVALLFLLAAVLRTGAAMRTAAMFDDGPVFLELAQLMGEGEWSRALTHPYHPLYPFATFVFHGVVDDWERAALCVSIVSGSAAVVALYFFLRHAFDAQTARIGGLLLAVLPYAATFSADIQSEGLYLALFVGALACLWRALQLARVRLAALAGLMAGLAYLTRPEGIGVVVVGAGLAGLMVTRRAWAWRRGASWLAALLVGATIVVGPYVVLLRVETGVWALTQKKSISNLVRPPAEETPAEPRTPEASDPGDGHGGSGGALRSRGSGSPVARTEPGVGSERSWKGVVRSGLRLTVQPAGIASIPRLSFPPAAASVGTSAVAPRTQRSAPHRMLLVCVSVIPPPVLVLIAVGLYACRGRPGWRALFVGAFLLSYGVVIYGLAHNVGYVTRRHVLPPLIPMLGYAATGVPVVGAALLRVVPRLSASPRLRARLAVWLCLVLVSIYCLPKILAVHREDRLAVRRAAEWLAGRPDLDGAVAAEKRRVAYYAGKPFVDLDRHGEEVDSALLFREGARFLVIDDRRLEAYSRLWRSRDTTLRALHTAEAVGHSAVVFELRARE